jgi:hypothetical protein
MIQPTGYSRKPSRNRCANLRWKGLYIDAYVDPHEPNQSNDSALWCQHTFTCMGPDNQVVDEFECNPTRGCYEKL